MEKEKKEEILDTIIGTLGSASGAAVGAGIGLLCTGPAGVLLGALGGSAIETVFDNIGTEIKKRLLSKTENRRISTVYSEAISKVIKNYSEGKPLRNADFFEASNDARSSAEEILEGTILAAQRENEEKKLPYMANLYANIVFDESVSRPMANQLIRLAMEITYRQFVILSIIGKSTYNILDTKLKDTPFRGFDNFNDMSIAAEIYDLYRRSILISSEAILDAGSFTPSLLVMNGMGELLYNLMELKTMEINTEAEEIIVFLSDGFYQPPSNAVIAAPLTTKEEVEGLINAIPKAYSAEGVYFG